MGDGLGDRAFVHGVDDGEVGGLDAPGRQEQHRVGRLVLGILAEREEAPDAAAQT
jgi:hypothetical protein